MLNYLPASQTVSLLPLMQHHRRYYSAADYRFPVAAGDRGRKERKEDEEAEMAEEKGDEEWQVVQGVSLDSLYDVVPLPPGVEAGRLRLHPQALLIVR